MKSAALLLLISCVTYFSASAQSCMTKANIIALDAKWEDANLHPNPQFYKDVLSDNFVWVHNHASMIDTKESTVKRAENQLENEGSNTKSRIQSNVKVEITGNTAIVTGFTIVDRGPVPTKYHFMRTYVELDGKCLLAGNHTMAVPEEENN